MTSGPGWWELLRALWPVFTLVGALAVGGILLALKTMFTTSDQHQKHHARICDVETFVVEQRTALGILPTRQELGHQIARQGERIAEVRDDISEQLGEQGERIAGLEAGMRGVSEQLKTTNTYLHTIIERGMKS